MTAKEMKKESVGVESLDLEGVAKAVFPSFKTLGMSDGLSSHILTSMKVLNHYQGLGHMLLDVDQVKRSMLTMDGMLDMYRNSVFLPKELRLEWQEGFKHMPGVTKEMESLLDQCFNQVNELSAYVENGDTPLMKGFLTNSSFDGVIAEFEQVADKCLKLYPNYDSAVKVMKDMIKINTDMMTLLLSGGRNTK